MRLVSLILALVLAGPAAAAVPTQLPRGVEPVAYDLALTPDAAKLTFTGRMTVTVQVAKATDRMVLNAVGLTIGKASLDGKAAKAALDAKAQTATFTTGAPV